MNSDVYMSFKDSDYGKAWGIYTKAFEDLKHQAVQQHEMREEDFRALCDDLTIEKHVVSDDTGRFIGLSMLTNRLQSWPLISPAYFEHRWPEMYAIRRIWYVGFVCTEPNYRGAGAFPMLLESMTDGRRDNGIFVMDYCEQRIQQGIVGKVDKILTRIHGEMPVTRELDSQHFYSVDFRS